MVTTEHQDWTYPPFAAEEHDGFIWGRGALDMKGGVAMMVAAFLRAKVRELAPTGRRSALQFSAMKRLAAITAHDSWWSSTPSSSPAFAMPWESLADSAIPLVGHRFYPIMVAEKQCCIVQATLSGPGGHAAFPARNGTMAQLAAFLRTLNNHRLPVHIPTTTRLMIETLASALPIPSGLMLRQLLKPALTDWRARPDGQSRAELRSVAAQYRQRHHRARRREGQRHSQ